MVNSSSSNLSLESAWCCCSERGGSGERRRTVSQRGGGMAGRRAWGRVSKEGRREAMREARRVGGRL